MPHKIETRRLELILLTTSLIDDLLAGRRQEAQVEGGFVMPSNWPDEHDSAFLRMRREQIRADPQTEVWLARAMVASEDPSRSMIGHIGFHGPPREGTLEMGYTIFPAHRRRGHACEAAAGMMDWAMREHGIRKFILSISPDNTPSLAVAERLGFQRTGEQWDEEDGLEWVFELIREGD